MEMDKDQQKAVDIQVNAVVSAGAGSGKTRVLTERFSKLVQSGKCKVDEILTLTFTKKATVEMTGRIYKALKEKAPEAAKEFSKAQISTLDSYCAAIARQGARFYGISPDFTQDDESVKDSMRELALPFILEHKDNAAIKQLAKTSDFAQIAEDLLITPLIENSSVAEPVDFDAALHRQREEITQQWNKTVQEVSEHWAALFKDYDDECSMNKEPAGFKNFFATAKTISLPEPPVIDETYFTSGKSQDTIAFVQALYPIEKEKKPSSKNFPRTIADIEQLYEDISLLCSLASFVATFSTIQKACELLKEFQDQVNRNKRSTGVLTFHDVSSLALRILKEHPEIRALEKSRFKAIMIDEFQDNNTLQRDLLFLLAERPERNALGVPEVSELCTDKLFFVGDEKQSIYRFRGADVSVFRMLKDSFPDGNLELKTNYRSELALVAAFNTLFGGFAYPYSQGDRKNGIFASSDSKAANYEAQYSKVEFSKKKADEADSSSYTPRVHIALYPKPVKDANAPTETDTNDEELSADESEALWVATKIDEIRNRERTADHEFKYSQVAILQRTMTKQAYFERALLNKGIPYTNTAVKNFFNDGPVNDLFAMLSICAFPSDINSYAIVLRSPFVNLSSEETFKVLAASKEEAFFSTKQEAELNEASRKRFAHARDFYTTLCTAAKSSPLTKIVSILWNEYGYRYETQWNIKVSMYGTAFDYFFEMARNAESRKQGLADFIDSLRSLKDPDKKTDGINVLQEKSDGVQIMTVHASKGLEFPYVFVVGLSSGERAESNSSPVYSGRDFGISINIPAPRELSKLKLKNTDKITNYFYKIQEEKETSMRTAELRRIFYVACTRAEKELYLTGNYTPVHEDSKGNETGGFLDGDSYRLDGDKTPRCFLHLLFPALKTFSSSNGKTAKDAPFTFEDIPAVTRSEHLAAGTKDENTREQKQIVMQHLKTAFDAAKPIEKETVKKPYVFPSKLHTFDDETSPSEEILKTAEQINVPYQSINDIVKGSVPKNSMTPEFSFADFGIIVHAYMESIFTHKPPVISNAAITGLHRKQAEFEKIKAICQEMKDKFLTTPLAQQALASDWVKTEYPFKAVIGGRIVKGTLDLVFKNSDGSGYTIVDYKTNQKIEPELYYEQQECYREAVAAMKGCDKTKVSCHLYFLRFAQETDITDGCTACTTTLEAQIQDCE